MINTFFFFVKSAYLHYALLDVYFRIVNQKEENLNETARAHWLVYKLEKKINSHGKYIITRYYFALTDKQSFL